MLYSERYYEFVFHCINLSWARLRDSRTIIFRINSIENVWITKVWKVALSVSAGHKWITCFTFVASRLLFLLFYFICDRYLVKETESQRSKLYGIKYHVSDKRCFKKCFVLIRMRRLCHSKISYRHWEARLLLSIQLWKKWTLLSCQMSYWNSI